MARETAAGHAGRSLIELLVATGAALLVLLAVTALLAVTLRWGRADRAVIDRQRAVRNAADRIAKDIRQAGAVRWSGRLTVTRAGVSHHYQVTDDRLELVDAAGNVHLVLRPVTAMTARVEPWTNVVNLTLESQTPDGNRFSVSQQITPRVVIP